MTQTASLCVYGGSRYVMCIFNADFNELSWKLPDIDNTMTWNLLLDSSSKFTGVPASDKTIRVPGWSVLVFEIKR